MVSRLALMAAFFACAACKNVFDSISNRGHANNAYDQRVRISFPVSVFLIFLTI